MIQWLATNVGQSLLEAAGYKYTQYDDDRAARENRVQVQAIRDDAKATAVESSVAMTSFTCPRCNAPPRVSCLDADNRDIPAHPERIAASRALAARLAAPQPAKP